MSVQASPPAARDSSRSIASAPVVSGAASVERDCGVLLHAGMTTARLKTARRRNRIDRRGATRIVGKRIQGSLDQGNQKGRVFTDVGHMGSPSGCRGGGD